MNKRSNSRGWSVVAMFLAAGACVPASAFDVTDAAARVAEARAAYEAALAELQAAEAALAASEGERPTAPAASVAAQPDVSAPAAGEAAAATAPSRGFFDWDAWKKSVDIGVNGASGNTESLNLRIQVAGERNTDKTETKVSALYRTAKESGETTQNQFRFDVFNDWLPPEGSRIRWWAKGAYEFDDFQAWDHRLSASAGIGYELIKEDKHLLVGRLGFGGSQTYGDDDEDFRPEAVAGLDYTFQIKENQKFTAGTELLLDVTDSEYWRTNSYARYEIVLDEASGLNLKTGVTHQYDSQPGGDARKSDLQYFATLGWTF